MKLKDTILEAASAGFSGIWIDSNEHEEAIKEIAKACKQQGWIMTMWDPDYGYRKAGDKKTPTTDINPLTALMQLRSTVLGKNRALLVMRNLTHYLSQQGNVTAPHILQTIQHIIEEGGSTGHHVVILAGDHVRMLPDLEKLMYLVEHNLPDKAELREVMMSVVDEEKDEIPVVDSPEEVALLDAAAGLTRYEAQGAFSLSLARHQVLRPDTLWTIKEQMLKKAGLLEMHRPSFGFDALGGLAHLKSFCKKALTGQHKKNAKVKAKGVLVLGLPGTGKSAFAKALGAEVNRPTITLDIGALFGKFIGESEGRVRQALRQIDSMAPGILFID